MEVVVDVLGIFVFILLICSKVVVLGLGGVGEFVINGLGSIIY